MTIRIISDREVTLQMQIDVQGKALQKAMNEAIALKAERDEYQQAADKMAMEHKVERDTLRHQLSEAQALIEASRKQEPVARVVEKVIRGLRGAPDIYRYEFVLCAPALGPCDLFSAPVVADDLLKDAERYRVALSNCIDAIENCQALFNHKPLEGFAKTCAGANDIALELARTAMGGAA